MAQQLKAMDKNTLAQLQEAGSDLSKPHEIDYWLYFPTQQFAQAAAAELKGKGFLVKSVAQSGKEWRALAHKSMVLSSGNVATTTSLLETLAASHSGDFDGWETKVVQ